MNDLRERLIVHILQMKQHDTDYARYALKQYADQMPWLDLVAGIKEALK